MPQDYLPAFVFIVLSILVGILFITLGYILGPRRPSEAKNEAYECGFLPFENARMKFDVRYYLVAVLFILFDLEVAFMFPWAIIYKDLINQGAGLYGLVAIFIFLFIITVGFVYEWKKGALEWE